MADYGVKISKEGKDVSSQVITDYVFWSKYQSLPLLYKVSLNITITSASCGGTETYTHNLGFFPLVLATVTDPGGDRFIIPYSMYQGAGGKSKCFCDAYGGGDTDESFTATIKLNTIDIIYDVSCVIPQVGSCCAAGGTYIVDLYVFMFELGS